VLSIRTASAVRRSLSLMALVSVSVSCCSSPMRDILSSRAAVPARGLARSVSAWSHPSMRAPTRAALLSVLLTALALVTPTAAAAEFTLPPGFAAQPYVTGDGFSSDTWRGLPGIPSTATLTVDANGVLYLARSGRRYSGGETDDLTRIYRIPAGGARLTPETEPRFQIGPPLPNPQVGAVRNGRELLLTTFDRDRAVGVLYRLVDGRAELLAGGTPARGEAPLFKQPEGVVVDGRGALLVADRVQGTVVRLDAQGGVLDTSL